MTDPLGLGNFSLRARLGLFSGASRGENRSIQGKVDAVNEVKRREKAWAQKIENTHCDDTR